MKTKQMIFSAGQGWADLATTELSNAQIVLFFGDKRLLANPENYHALQNRFPNALMFGCSSAGEISNVDVQDNTIVATAISFKNTRVTAATMLIDQVAGDSFLAGEKLAQQLPVSDDLKVVIVLSDGTNVKGTELVDGISSVVREDIPITGGLAGDGSAFESTLVSCNCTPEVGRIAIVGLYGSDLEVGCGYAGGWDSFGPTRKITKSKANVLYSLDGRPALDLYKEYLGEKASELPSSGLLFPLMIKKQPDQNEEGTVRTVQAVNENDSSVTFTADLREGFHAQLMTASLDRLVEGAITAAELAKPKQPFCSEDEHLAILVSCVGRKLVLGQRVADEVESVMDVLTEDTQGIGFYSYGEISPHVDTGQAQLHNQTMTVVTLFEKQ